MIRNLNNRTERVVEAIIARSEELGLAVHSIVGGGRWIDCGIEARGGLQAGIALARVCLADLAEVQLVPGELGGRPIPMIQVVTDHPVQACLGSQYAGWAISIKDDKYFAMGSGPMRAANGEEPLYDKIGFRERASGVVGVLETRKPPTPLVVAKIASACHVEPSSVTLLAAPTASIAGGLQVVARSVETTLHKMIELEFDMKRIVSATGLAPLPPVAKNDLAAIGRTNDSMLYGARVNLFVTGDDESLAAIGPKIPSSSSKDYGEPFEAIFKRYNHDFYSVDPMLFSPAEVVLQNFETGRVQCFGSTNNDVLARSFFGQD